MKTYSAKASEIQKQWVLIDADGLIVGRLAAIIANRLRGKHKPTFTPHMDCGDNIIVINCEKLAFSGKKDQQKRYYHHTGFPGGIKERSVGQLQSKAPERVLQLAVQRMLPGAALKRLQMTHLRIFKGPEHDHVAQNPVVLDVKAMNAKNVVRG